MPLVGMAQFARQINSGQEFFLVPVDLNIVGEKIKNMADDGAQYWVKVWNASEIEKLQMVSTSRYFTVSLAAWQAAAGRQPGMLLIHYNGRQIWRN